MSLNDKSSPSYLSEPTVQYLSQVLEEIKVGGLMVPRFQRELVWDDDQRLDLLRSILSGIPIGSILVWRTTEHRLETFPNIGPHKLPSYTEPTPGAPRQYLLDGLQRMSTLIGALMKPDRLEAGANIQLFDEIDSGVKWDSFYDLDENDFILGNTKASKRCIPTQAFLDSVLLLQFQRSLGNERDGDLLIRQADRIANAFRNYKIPVIPIMGNSLEDATKAFQRINSTGTPMSDVHMVAALTFSKNFDLSKRLEELGASLDDIGWSGLDKKYILASVRAANGLEISSPKAEQLSHIIKDKPELLDKAIENLKLAINFLSAECNIPSPAFLPYSYQAVVLAEAYRLNPDPESNIKTELRKWLWSTSYSAFFLGARSTQMSKAIETIHQIAKGVFPVAHFSETVEPLPKKFDLHSARAKCLAIRMAELKSTTQLESNKRPIEIIKAYGSAAFVQLITRDQSNLNYAFLRGPENRFLNSPETWQTDKNILTLGYLAEDFRDKSNAITSEARKALDNYDYPKFLSLRRKHLIDMEKEFSENLGLNYAISIEDQSLFP